MQQSAHLLAPLDLPHVVEATLASRLRGQSDLESIAEQIDHAIAGPYLRSLGPLPDQPHPALRRVLAGHTASVTTLAIAPDGRWLATAAGDPFGGDHTVRIWGPATGQCRYTLTGHTHAVTTLAIAPDSSWLATATGPFGADHTVRIWDPATGQCRHTLTGHTHAVTTLAIAPNSRWLATTGTAGTVLIWDPVQGCALAALQVDSSLYLAEIAGDTLAVAGGHGPYFFTLAHGPSATEHPSVDATFLAARP